MSLFNIKQKKSNNENDFDNAYDNDYYSNDDMGYSEEESFADQQKDDIQIEETPKRSVPLFGGASSGSAFEMKLLKPTSYKEAPAIADYLINRCAVVLNLESANKETASNLIYFLTGVSYALGGQIKRVAANTYMLAPENMEISEDARHSEGDSAKNDDLGI